MNRNRDISGKPSTLDPTEKSWSPVARSLCTSEFLNKLDRRRAKNKVAKASRRKNRV